MICLFSLLSCYSTHWYYFILNNCHFTPITIRSVYFEVYSEIHQDKIAPFEKITENPRGLALEQKQKELES
jgi:hypothetical protein